MTPLAERLRPGNFEKYIRWSDIDLKNQTLLEAAKGGNLPSLLLWGPPGSGKTTLARILGDQPIYQFIQISAVDTGVKEVRSIIEKGEGALQRVLLFIDEIHRFSRSQQDSLLDAIERGVITLIGATTENPSFEIIPPLLSRLRLYQLTPFGDEEMGTLLERAISEDKVLQKKKIGLKEKGALISSAGGDARKLLNNLEWVVLALEKEMPPQSSAETGENADVDRAMLVIDDEAVARILPGRVMGYDKDREYHYTIVSALIKSIRGSDPNGAVYWLARMIEGGEKPEFIARRLVILAAEDVGLANPNALMLANSAFEAVLKVGWPESRIILSECAIYLAVSPKSNSAYIAINEAQALVKKTGDLAVPNHLVNAPTRMMKDLGIGKGYRYPHDYQGGFTEQDYLPEQIKGSGLYRPGENQRESEVKKWLTERWKGRYRFDSE